MLVYIMIFVSRFGRVARGMWWLAIGRCYIGALCSCLFNNVVFLFNFLTLTLSENGFAEQLAVEWPPPMLNPGYATVAHDDANIYKGDIQPHLFTGFSIFLAIANSVFEWVTLLVSDTGAPQGPGCIFVHFMPMTVVVLIHLPRL